MRKFCKKKEARFTAIRLYKIVFSCYLILTPSNVSMRKFSKKERSQVYLNEDGSDCTVSNNKFSSVTLYTGEENMMQFRKFDLCRRSEVRHISKIAEIAKGSLGDVSKTI